MDPDLQKSIQDLNRIGFVAETVELDKYSQAIENFDKQLTEFKEKESEGYRFALEMLDFHVKHYIFQTEKILGIKVIPLNVHNTKVTAYCKSCKETCGLSRKDIFEEFSQIKHLL